jgi:hypothetical protein
MEDRRNTGWINQKLCLRPVIYAVVWQWLPSLLPRTSSCWRLGLRHQQREKAGENNHIIEFLISIHAIFRISVTQRTERRLKQTEFLTSHSRHPV